VTFKTEHRNHHRVLDGAGPWTEHIGACSIEIEIHGSDGILGDAGLMLDAEIHMREGRFEDRRRRSSFRNGERRGKPWNDPLL
jgi:hypothetical protein